MTRRKDRRYLGCVGIAVVGVFTLTLSGCGSKAKSATNAASTAEISIASAFPINSAALAFPEAKAGLQAAVSAVNAAGGVGGKMLKLTVCDTKFDVNTEISCARQMTTEKVSAVIDPLFFASPTGQPTKQLTDAGIPIIGSIGLSPLELSNALVYPLGSGLPGWQYGAVNSALAAGAKHVSILASAGPSSEFSAKLAADALKLAKLTPQNTVIADAKADPTLATAAAKATSGGTDAIVFAMVPQDMPKAIAAIRQSGFKGILSSSTAALPEVVIKALGSAADGILLTTDGVSFLTDTQNSGIAAFKSEMAKYEPQGKLNDVSLQMWASVKLFAAAAAGGDPSTAAGVVKAMNSLSTPIGLKMLAPYSIDKVVSPLPSFPRLLNPTVVYGSVKGGTMVAKDEFVNPFTALQAR